MLFSYSLAAASAMALTASAATIRIDVGNGGLKFTPNTTTAAQGDILEFHFYALNHSVVAGRFDQACVPMQQGGFYSGFVPVAANSESPNVFAVTVNDTKPLAFYCSQNTRTHCKSGMYGVINPSGQDTLEAYGRLAGNVSTAVSPNGGAFGGAFSASTGTTTTTSGGSQTTPPPTGTGANGGNSPTTTTTSSSKAVGEAIHAPVGGVLGAVLAAALML